MLIEITANQAKVLQLLIDCMRPEEFPDLEPIDFLDAGAVLSAIQEPPPLRTRIAQAWRHVARDDSG